MWKKSMPERDYYAVIFSSEKSGDLEGYQEMDELTMELAWQQNGFLGYESCSNGNKSVFISYWESREAVDDWRKNMVHIQAKSNAKQWYKRYLSQICKVENSKLFEQ